MLGNLMEGKNIKMDKKLCICAQFYVHSLKHTWLVTPL